MSYWSDSTNKAESLDVSSNDSTSSVMDTDASSTKLYISQIVDKILSNERFWINIRAQNEGLASVDTPPCKDSVTAETKEEVKMTESMKHS